MNKGQQISYYENLLSTYGDHFLSLDWKSTESQEARFKIFEDLVNMLDPKNFSVLDVGCGFGDLYQYLAKMGHHFSYLGVDLSSKILDIAKNRHPKAAFAVKDILEDKKYSQYDFVFCSGTLNIAFTERDAHLEYICSMLIRMFELCKIGVGANFLSSKAVYYVKDEDLQHSQYFYTKPEEIAVIAKGMTDRFVIRHDYHPGDFTVYLLK